MDRRENEKAVMALSAAKNAVVWLERLCPGGSESSGLLGRRGAADDKTRDGEQRRDSCAHCADEAEPLRDYAKATFRLQQEISALLEMAYDVGAQAAHDYIMHARNDMAHAAEEIWKTVGEVERRASEASVRRNDEVTCEE